MCSVIQSVYVLILDIDDTSGGDAHEGVTEYRSKSSRGGLEGPDVFLFFFLIILDVLLVGPECMHVNVDSHQESNGHGTIKKMPRSL